MPANHATSHSIARSDEFKQIFIQEGNFIVKNLNSDEDRILSYQLRHRIFAEELGWVPTSPACLEIDDYDSNAVPIGVIGEQGELLALVRIIPPRQAFMVEKEFSMMIDPGHKIRKHSDAAEASRLCILPEARNVSISDNFGMHNLTLLILKGLYHWCSMNSIRYLYAVIERRVHRMLNARGIVVEPAGDPVIMPDGCVAMAVVLDWHATILRNKLKRPEMAKWFIQYQSGQSGWPLQQPEFCSPLEVSP